MNQIVYRPGAWQVVVDDGGVIAVPPTSPLSASSDSRGCWKAAHRRSPR